MAEAVLRHKVAEAGLSEIIHVDSAGTGDWHSGEPPHRGTRQTLEKRSISYQGMTARQITREDLEDYDYILTMDEDNLHGVRRLGPARGQVRPLMEFADHLNTLTVPDPYYDGRFEEVYRLVDAACEGLLATIRDEYDL